MANNPKHIAIILDGNRRYGEKIGNRLKGHIHGLKKVEELLKWCRDLGIKELTLYAFSTENFNRSEKEVRYIMNLFRRYIKRLKNDKNLQKNKLKINFIGRLGLFPKDIQKEMEEVMEKTKGNDSFKVNFAMGYGGRSEIIDATKRLIEDFKDNKIKIEYINEELFSNYLYLKNDPDILIRPGGEKRISNFLLWQSSYTELFFIDKLWPEFTKNDLVEIIDEFKKRERRFGK